MVSIKAYAHIRRALCEARQNKGLTQAEVASSLAKPQSFVSKYESGERKLDIIDFLQVCEALKLEPAAVLREVRSA